MLKQFLKVITYNDPFLCLHALKIIYLSLLVQAQCRTELSLPLNNPALSWLHCSPQSVCEQQFKGLVSPSQHNLNEASSSPLPV